MPGIVSKLSGTTKNLTAGLMSDPQKMENIISMVRTVAPLTSQQTVSKVNTYLPLFEKISTLLGMYSFLNRAQTFTPIESLNAKSPMDVMAAFAKNTNMPVSKMLAQPLIANNIEKMMGTMAMNMIKNGGMNDLLKNGDINDILSNENISNMISSFTQNSEKNPSDGNLDLNSLMETFMPIISNMSTSNSNNKDDGEYEDYSNKLKNESYLPDEEFEEADYNSSEEYIYDKKNDTKYDENYSNKYEKYDKPQSSPYDRNYKNDRYDYEKSINYNEHKNNYNEKKLIQKPIRIKQRKRK